MKGCIKMLKQYKSIIEKETDFTISHLDNETLEKARDLIIDCENNYGRVHVTGIGKPSYVAGYIASLFSSIGIPAYFLDGTEAVHGSSGQVKKGDVVIAISNSGQTKELLYAIETLKANNTKIISVSRSLDSALSKAADVAICAYVEEEGDDLNKPPRASIISEIITLQGLSILLQEYRKLDSKMYVKWHPGGALGEVIRNGKEIVKY